jgi:hypothetical protein
MEGDRRNDSVANYLDHSNKFACIDLGESAVGGMLENTSIDEKNPPLTPPKRGTF